MVTVETGDTQQGPDTGRRPAAAGLILGVVGLAVGLAMGALFSGGPAEDAGPGSTVVGEPDASPTVPTTTTTNPPPARLATMVPGMLDTMLAAAIDRSGTFVVTTWEPSDRDPHPGGLPWGNLEADASRLWLVTTTPSRWTEQQTLWVGNRSYMEPVSSTLEAQPVWHTRTPGLLAWLESGPDGVDLMVASFAAGQPATPRRITTLAPGTALVWWNDAGLVTITYEGDGEGVLTLLDDAGSPSATMEISWVEGAGQEMIAVRHRDGRSLLLGQGLDVAAEAPWEAACDRIVFGPQDGFAAVARCGSGAESRFEFWPSVLADTEPRFVLEAGDITDLGFTSDGLPYVATIDALRPTTVITFFHPIDDTVHEVTYPGRALWLETVR